MVWWVRPASLTIAKVCIDHDLVMQWVRTNIQGIGDHPKYRMKPNSSTKTAVYKASLEEWETIRMCICPHQSECVLKPNLGKHGIRPPPGEDMIVLSANDRLDDTGG